MRNKTMDVKELKQNQLDELKYKVFYLNENDIFYNMLMESWDDDIQLEYEKAQYPYDISNKTIYKLFCGIDFVNGDFSCSCEK